MTQDLQKKYVRFVLRDCVWPYAGKRILERVENVKSIFFNPTTRYRIEALSLEADDGIFDPCAVQTIVESLRVGTPSKRPRLPALRGGPWPHTGKRRRYGHWYRAPRTHAEIIANSADMALAVELRRTFGISLATKRMCRRLRTARDEVRRGKQRNWKKARKTRWR